MASNLDGVLAAIKKADAERQKLLKEWKAAKAAPEKEKLKKMAEGARKIALAYFEQIDAAKAKDRAAMLEGFKEMGL